METSSTLPLKALGFLGQNLPARIRHGKDPHQGATGIPCKKSIHMTELAHSNFSRNVLYGYNLELYTQCFKHPLVLDFTF